MNTNTGKSRGFGANKGKRKGSTHKLKQWERRTLAKNILLALTPLELKFLLLTETEKFIQLCKVPLVRRVIELHGVNLQGFIEHHLDLNDANLLMFADTLRRIDKAPEGVKHKQAARKRARKRKQLLLNSYMRAA